MYTLNITLNIKMTVNELRDFIIQKYIKKLDLLKKAAITYTFEKKCFLNYINRRNT